MLSWLKWAGGDNAFFWLSVVLLCVDFDITSCCAKWKKRRLGKASVTTSFFVTNQLPVDGGTRSVSHGVTVARLLSIFRIKSWWRWSALSLRPALKYPRIFSEHLQLFLEPSFLTASGTLQYNSVPRPLSAPLATWSLRIYGMNFVDNQSIYRTFKFPGL